MSLAKATYVKAAAKDNPVAKKGEPYWHWSHFRGPKQYSKEQPKNSQLESNENAAAAYEVEEEVAAYGTGEDTTNHDTGKPWTHAWCKKCMELLAIQRDEWVQRLQDAADAEEEKFENLPEQFQQADTGTAIQERYENIRAYADELEAIDLDEIDDMGTEFDYEEEYDTRLGDLQGCGLNI